jgi:hypothetical protein
MVWQNRQLLQKLEDAGEKHLKSGGWRVTGCFGGNFDVLRFYQTK